MTERARVLSVLDGRRPDRTPWFGDLSWWHAAHARCGDLPKAYGDGADGYLRMHRDAGVGIYLYPPFVWDQRYDESVTVTVETEGDLTATTIVTPVGSVRSVLQGLPESGTSAYVEHNVKAPGDLRVLRYLAQHRIITPNSAQFAECDAHWGEDGIACALAPVCTTALQTLITREAGIETVVDLLYSDARSELEETIEVMQAADDPIFEIIARSPCRLVVFPENLSGEVTGRQLVQRYEMPCWKRRIAQLQNAGKSVGIHNDGTLRGSLPLLIEAGFDLVESVTPAPVGDMPLEEIRGVTAGKIIVWGGIPGALFSPLTSADVFDAFVALVLRTLPPGSGFVLGVADQVPPDAEFSRICRVRELVDELGG